MDKDGLQEHLVKGQKLPPSSLDRRFIKIERDMIVHVTDDDVPLFLKALLPSDWKKDSNLRSDFLLYLKPGEKATKKKRQSPIVFPYALLDLAIQTKSLHEVLIVVNYWLNLTKDEQKAKWVAIRTMFVEPRRSSKLLHVYDPEKPQAVGIFDEQRFREQRVLQSASHAIINASKARRFVSDKVTTNPQLRDWLVQRGEERMQQALATTSERSEFEHATAFFEPIIMTTSTVYTPTKNGGRPSNEVRDEAKVVGYARNKMGVMRHLDALLAMLKSDIPSLSTCDDLTTEKAFDAMNKVVEFHYVQDGKLPGVEASKKRKKSDEQPVIVGTAPLVAAVVPFADAAVAAVADDSDSNSNDLNEQDHATIVLQDSMQTMQSLHFEFLYNAGKGWSGA